ncbi:MAG: hypothetical protein AABO57_19110 [Acidobacteriota bacterium]
MSDSVNSIHISESRIRIGVRNIENIQRSNQDVDMYASLMYWAYSLVGRRVPEWYMFGGDRDTFHFNSAVDALQSVAGEELDVRSIMIDELEKRRP